MPYKQIKTYGKVKKVNVIAEGESKYGNKMILAEVPFSLPHITAFVIYQWHPTYKEFRHFARFLANKEEVERVRKRAVEAFKLNAKNIKMYPDKGSRGMTFKSVTEIPYYDEMLKNPDYFRKSKGLVFRIEVMSPDEYMRRIAEMHNVPVSREWEHIDASSVNYLLKQVQEGKALPMPVIDYSRNLQEGRNRIAVAKKLGVKKVPVMIVERLSEKGREKALMRMRGAAEPTRWLDVTAAYQKHYDLTKKALLKAVGGNIQRIKEYWASPFEAYYKIAITLNKPITAVFRLKDRDYLEFNGQLIPLFINERAYTPYRLRLVKYFSDRNLQKELEAKHTVKLQIENFYIQVDNPAWWSRLEQKFVPRPCQITFAIYK